MAAKEISDEERILLFEWHAKHLRSWSEVMYPSEEVCNLPRGMETEMFHKVSSRLMLLRKFYDTDHVNLGKVSRSIQAMLPDSEKTLRDVLRTISFEYREFIAQSKVFVAESPLRADDIYYNVLYGLLIHSDPDRARSLCENSRGWQHNAMIVQNGYFPIMKTLATIEECRSKSLFQLGDPYPSFWEQQEPRGYSIEEIAEELDLPMPWSDR